MRLSFSSLFNFNFMTSKFTFSKQIHFFLFAIIFTLISSCENDKPLFISLDQEIELGRQLDSAITADPQQYPVLDPEQYPDAYNYLENIFTKILNSGEVRYKEEFPWQIKIIEDDSTLNAFAAPGGFIYVYTGLIKYLDKEDDLVGVLGHEIAHADLRHSARNIEKQYGLSIVLSVILGENAKMLGDIAVGLVGLKFSRDFETEADRESVEYLSGTNYNCAAASSFFQKLTELGQTGNVPEFLSTHPNPPDRVENITEKAQEVGCSTDPLNPASYQDFKNMLP